jgi:hypothetical protein
LLRVYSLHGLHGLHVFYYCVFLYVQGNRLVFTVHAFYCFSGVIIRLCSISLLYRLVLLSVILGLDNVVVEVAPLDACFIVGCYAVV